MPERGKSKAQLIRDLRMLRRRVADLEAAGRGSSVCEELFRFLVHAMPDTIYMLDSRGKFEFIKKRSGMAINFTFDDLGCRLSPKKEITLYRIAQQAITNIVEHAEAGEAAVSLRKKSGSVILKIRDRGKGFVVSDSRRAKGMGLLGMRERIDSVGGTLRISSHPGKGSVVEAKVPC